jgi:hypothetical protein
VALIALGFIGPRARAAAPAVLKRLNDRNELVVAAVGRTVLNVKSCEWIYRISANAGTPTGGVLPTFPVLGTLVVARVASPRCPLLRPDFSSLARGTPTVQITYSSLATSCSAELRERETP